MSQTFGKVFAKKEEGKVRPISAAFAALACAVGASNIVGVPVAIALGGPGAVFWIWVLAILGMCTKYCEVALGIKYRRKNDVGEWVGGPAYYLRGLGKKIGVVFGVGYAFFFMIELVPSRPLRVSPLLSSSTCSAQTRLSPVSSLLFWWA